MSKAYTFSQDWKRFFVSDDYNYQFDMLTGKFARWGKTLDDDPLCAPVPEILDIEVSTVCSGIPKIGSDKCAPCKFCYKGNASTGKNMSLDTFQKIINKWPLAPLQIAFGIGDINANSDFFEMVKWARKEKSIIPNYTTNGYGLTQENIEDTAHYCGAVAVSSYEQNKNVCYDAVSEFVKNKNYGMIFSDFPRSELQVNIHCLLSKETLPFCYEVCEDIKKVERQVTSLNRTRRIQKVRIISF
jgi:hypothetical protein